MTLADTGGNVVPYKFNFMFSFAKGDLSLEELIEI